MLEGLFIRILNMSLTGSLMILAVLLARLVLRKAPKLFSYALWLVVLFRLFCPISFESGFSLLGVLGATTAEQGTVEYISQPLVSGIQSGQTLQNPETIAQEGEKRQELWQEGASAAQKRAFWQNTESLRTALRIGSVIWLIGVSGLLFYGGGSYMRLKRKMNLVEAKECSLSDLSDDITLSAAVGSVQICRTDAISTAFVLGFLHPTIYLPKGLEEKEERCILLHEQIHITRGDSLFRAAAYLALCLHWFNPFAWLAFYLSGKDMEMSCDEAVIRQIGSSVKKEYSQTLLSLAAGPSKIKGVPLAFGEGDTGSRIKNVLRYKKPTVILVAVAVVLCLTAAVFLLGNPKKEFGDTVYYGIVKVSNNEDEEQNVVFVPGLGEMEIPEAEIVEPYIEIDFAKLEPGQLVRMTFSGNVKVNLSSDMQGSFSETAKSIYVMGIGFDIRPSGEGRYLFTVPIGMANEAAEGDVLQIYHHISSEGDIREMYHLYLLDSPDKLKPELFASTVVEAVDQGNYDIWVTLSTEEVQTFLSEFGYGVYCEIADEARTDSAIAENENADRMDAEGEDVGNEDAENEILAITPELLLTYGGSLPNGTYWVQALSIARSARGIDLFRVFDTLDTEWDDDKELPFLAFDEDCMFLANRELDSIRYEEISFDEFAKIVTDVLEYRWPVLNITFLDGLIIEASIQDPYFGFGFSSAPSVELDDTWYRDIQGITGLSAEEVIEEYYTLVRTENADVADAAGEETIEIYTGNIGDGDSGIVMIRDSSGNLLNTLSAHASRAGWNNIYLGEAEGTPYLLEVHIEDRDTYGGYGYGVFRLDENGKRLYIADTYFEFYDGGGIGYDDDLFHTWADKLEYYLENSRLLLSTQEGEVRTEAVSEAGKYNYETLKR